MNKQTETNFSIKDNPINLTEFARKTLEDRYLIKGESYEDFFMRIAIAYSDNKEHSLRMYDYMTKKWFIPATPILTNGGTTIYTRPKIEKSDLYPKHIKVKKRGLPISCFVNHVEDTLDSINNTLVENINISANGGGIGTAWNNVRGMGEKIRENGSSGGVIPFMKILDGIVLAISQGKTRRGAAAVYLDVSHPDIEDFLYIRKVSGGDVNRKCLNIHHGILVTDKFVEHVKENKPWQLISPKTNKVVKEISARGLLIRILTMRIETGEPYILFIDTINKNLPEVQRKLGLKIHTSNLCSEITLPTGLDYNKKIRTGVCCLGSVNLEYYEDFVKNDDFIIDCMRFLDNVLTDFEVSAPDEFENAKYSVKMERSVGLGAMGLHSFYQKKNISMESLRARIWNKDIFKYISEKTKIASRILAEEKGPCEDAKNVGLMERNSNTTAIAPTATISIIADSSPGIEPYNKNIYMHKTVVGSSTVKNKYLEVLLEKKGLNNDEIWESISSHEGSVQHLDCLSDEEKQVFKTSFEIDQSKIIKMAGDRQQYITQGQSLNLFLLPEVKREVLIDLFLLAHESGVKGMYYLRSQSSKRAEKDPKHQKTYSKATNNTIFGGDLMEECDACQ